MNLSPILHVMHPSSPSRRDSRIDQLPRELVDRADFDRRQMLSIGPSSTPKLAGGEEGGGSWARNGRGRRRSGVFAPVGRCEDPLQGKVRCASRYMRVWFGYVRNVEVRGSSPLTSTLLCSRVLFRCRRVARAVSAPRQTSLELPWVGSRSGRRDPGVGHERHAGTGCACSGPCGEPFRGGTRAQPAHADGRHFVSDPARDSRRYGATAAPALILNQALRGWSGSECTIPLSAPIRVRCALTQ